MSWERFSSWVALFFLERALWTPPVRLDFQVYVVEYTKFEPVRLLTWVYTPGASLGRMGIWIFYGQPKEHGVSCGLCEHWIRYTYKFDYMWTLNFILFYSFLMQNFIYLYDSHPY